MKLSLIWFMLLIAFVLVACSVQGADWYVYNSSYVNRTRHGKPYGVALNQTKGTVYTFYVTDYYEGVVYSYTPQFGYIENFTTVYNISNYPYGIVTNGSNATEGTRGFWYIQPMDRVVYRVGQSGTEVSNFSTPYPCSIDIAGMTTNVTGAPLDDFWITDTYYDEVCRIDASGSLVSHFSTVGFGSAYPTGIATNISDNSTMHLFIADGSTHSIYHTTGTGVLIETINLHSIGITNPKGVTVLGNNTVVNDIFVTSYTDKKLYWLKSVAAALVPALKDYAHNATNYTDGNQTWLPYGDTDYMWTDVYSDIGLDACWLETNQTGAWQNFTLGEYGSPRYFSGLKSKWNGTNFTWHSDLIKTAAGNESIAWKINCNDTEGNVNNTPEITFLAEPLVAQCHGNIINISVLNASGKTNISMNFTGTGSANCTFYIPFFGAYTNYTGCNYGASYAVSVKIENLTNDCLVNVSTVNLSEGNVMRIDKREEIKAMPPPSLPLAIASGIIGTILIIYVITSRRKSEGWT